MKTFFLTLWMISTTCMSLAMTPGFGRTDDRAATYWVDPAGSDSDDCSVSAPCRTIAYVLDQKAANGDIVMLAPGVYREQLDISHANLTLAGAGEGVYLLGSRIPGLTKVDHRYRAGWSWGHSYAETRFCRNLTNDVAVPAEACNTLGFWQNQLRLDQVFAQTDLEEGTFFYDESAQEVWIWPLPDAGGVGSIEGLASDYVLRLGRASRNVTIKNLNIWYGASEPDAGIFHVEGTGHVLEDVDVRYSAGAGIRVHGADGVTMKNIASSHHGQNGWRVSAEASFSSSSGWSITDTADDLTLHGSESHHNGWKGFDNCWGGGGTKFSFTRNLLIDGFYSADNNGFGIWLDIENHAYTVTRSLSARDAGRGVFVEYISDNGVVENNVVFATRDASRVGCGISVGLAAADSRNVVLRQNTVYSMDSGVRSIMLKTGCPTCRQFPYPSESITWENNLIVNKNSVGFVRDLDAGSPASFSYSGTAVERQFSSDASLHTCWDALGGCSQAALGIVPLPPDNYLADEQSECGFAPVVSSIAGRGAIDFEHPESGRICGTAPPPPAPQAPLVSFDVSTNSLEASFTDTSTDDGMIDRWEWDFGDGNRSTLQHPVHSYATSGVYQTALVVTDDQGLADRAVVEIVVEAPPPDPNPDPDPDPPPANDPPVAAFNVSTTWLEAGFTDTSSDDGAVAGWAWTFGDGKSSSERNPKHTYAAGGVYTVELTVTDDGGLTSSISRNVSVAAEEAGEGAFVENDGLVVFEAEHYMAKSPNAATGDEWTLISSDLDGSLVQAMQALDDDGDRVSKENLSENAWMKYDLSLTTAGTYYFWARVWALKMETVCTRGSKRTTDPEVFLPL